MISRTRAYFPMQFFSRSAISLPRRRHHYRCRRCACVCYHHRHTYFIPSAYAFNYNVSLCQPTISISHRSLRCAILHLPRTNYRGKVWCQMAKFSLTLSFMHRNFIRRARQMPNQISWCRPPFQHLAAAHFLTHSMFALHSGLYNYILKW